MKLKYVKGIVLCFCISACFHYPPPKTGLEGKPVPSFSFLLTDSTTRLTTDSIKPGRPFMLFYFNPDCPYCKAQLQEIIQHRAQFSNTTIYLLSNDPVNVVRAFFNEHQLNKYDNFITGVDYSNFLSGYFYITQVPYLAIYDNERRLREVFIGKTDINIIKEHFH